MKYKWTLIGFLLGLFTRRPQLIMFGLLAGFAADAGWFNTLFKSNEVVPPPTNNIVKDAYQILEVDAQASDSDIEAAYRRQIAQYHPDKVAGAAKEIRDLADKRASEINAAYDQIQKNRGKK
ncbi:MAG: DnaJ domain-containing protein [Arenimonas sp.]